MQVLSFILSHTTDGAGAAVLDAALSTELSPLKAKVSRPLLLAPLVRCVGLITCDRRTSLDKTLLVTDKLRAVSIVGLLGQQNNVVDVHRDTNCASRLGRS